MNQEVDESSIAAGWAQSAGDMMIQKRITNILSGRPTPVVVTVVAVADVDSGAPVGFVDVQRLSDATIHSNVPYFRVQVGSNAAVLEPCVGDFGVVIFHGPAGLYIGGVLASARTTAALAAYQNAMDGTTGVDPIPPLKTVMCDSGVYLVHKPPATATRAMPASALNRGPQKIGLFTL